MGGFEERRQRAQEYARKLAEAEARKKLEEQRKKDAELAAQKAEAAKYDQQQRLLAQEVLKKFNVEEALRDVKRDVWKEGSIEPTENGMGLRLVEPVPFLGFSYREYEYLKGSNTERGMTYDRAKGYWITRVSLQQIETNLKISYEKPGFMYDSFGHPKPLPYEASISKKKIALEAIAAQNPVLIIEDGEYFRIEERPQHETIDNRNKLEKAVEYLRLYSLQRKEMAVAVVSIDDPAAVYKVNQKLVDLVDFRMRRKSLPGEMRNAANSIIWQSPSALQTLGYLNEQQLDKWDGLLFSNRYGNSPTKTGKTFFKGFFG